MAVQAGDVAAYFIYRDDDKPKYRRGNTSLIAINILAIALFLGAKAYYVYENGRREKIWNEMSDTERNEYIKSTDVQGSKRLDFRFAHWAYLRLQTKLNNECVVLINEGRQALLPFKQLLATVSRQQTRSVARTFHVNP